MLASELSFQIQVGNWELGMSKGSRLIWTIVILVILIQLVFVAGSILY